MTPLQAISQKARALNVPISAHIDTTYRCNFICEHCILPSQFGGTELSTVEVVKVLEDLAALGTLFLTLSGGEVFLRKDLDDILAAADRLRFCTKLYTHGNFIDEARVAMLLARHVSEVQISFYSIDPCVHEKITRVPGSHAKSLHAIDLLVAAGVRVVLACPVTRYNFGSTKELTDFAKSRKIPIKISPQIQPTYSGELHTLSVATPSCELPNVYLEPWNESTLYALAKAPAAKFDDSANCGAARSTVYINPIGDVQGCALMGGLSAGNVRQRPLADIWRSSDVLKQIREIARKDREDCKRCENAKYCSFCMANSWQVTKTLLSPTASMCEQSNAKRLAVEEHKRRLPIFAAMADDPVGRQRGENGEGDGTEPEPDL
ncbi:MAG: radical SAM protein [Deltaproteobacteria bacterium]|nr:radical SAM protein [Deltaproteobacteria bacterium]